MEFDKIVEELKKLDIEVRKVAKTNPDNPQQYQIIGYGYDSTKTRTAEQIKTTYQRGGFLL